MAKSSTKSANTKPMTNEAAARIQRSTALVNNGQVPSGSFASRAQRAAAVHENSKPQGSSEN